MEPGIMPAASGRALRRSTNGAPMTRLTQFLPLFAGAFGVLILGASFASAQQAPAAAQPNLAPAPPAPAAAPPPAAAQPLPAHVPPAPAPTAPPASAHAPSAPPAPPP